LRPLFDTLTVDTMRFFPVTTDVIHHAELPGGDQSLREIQTAIASVIRAFGDIVMATDRFRDHCRTIHLNTLKRAAAALMDAATALDRQL